MPRMNLTEEEAESIRRKRELAAQHAVTYNQALDDVLSTLHKTPCGADMDMLAKQVARLRR